MAKIAICGYGVVGSGVAEVIAENSLSIEKNAGEAVEIKYILDLREFPDDPFGNLVTNNLDEIINDTEVSVVVETMGGAGFAYELSKRALSAGKSVVTSNKELVAKHGHELIAIAKEKNVNYLFEASVGGGIPIIRPITQCLTANKIDEVYGILNGTTNYILTQMIENGVDFKEALKDAQEKGYAEKDPTADVEGIDAARKICILSDLCFGKHVEPEDIKAEGISALSLEDVSYAKAIGYKIKLLGRGKRTGRETVSAYVAPHLISESSLLSNVHYVMNGIVVRGNALGEVMFYGAGAGKRPTASAVVADVIDAIKHSHARKFIDWDEAPNGYFTNCDEMEFAWLIRTKGSLQQIGFAFGDVDFVTYEGAHSGEYAFVTEKLSKKDVLEQTQGMNVVSMLRILD